MRPREPAQHGISSEIAKSFLKGIYAKRALRSHVVGEGQIGHVDRDELRASKDAGKAGLFSAIRFITDGTVELSVASSTDDVVLLKPMRNSKPTGSKLESVVTVADQRA